jgi:hypothetical protein
MNATARIFLTRLATLLVVAWIALTAAGCTTAHSQERTPAWSRAELEQLLAPVALYPDALLAQLLIAATYPDEIVEAARWSRMNPERAGEDALRAADVFDWDPSVKSLLAFPGLLARMDEKMDWTRALGDAFLAQEDDVMDVVQGLRRRAHIEGTLASDDHIRIVDEGPRIQIVFASPALVYVPYYDPRVVYGRWWWPSHPPVVWAPWPGYRFIPHAPGVRVGLWWSPGVRLSVGFFFGGIDWSRRQVQVVRVDTWYVHRAIERRAPQRVVAIKQGRWQHEPTRRHAGPWPTARSPQPAPRRTEVHRPEDRRPDVRQVEVRKPEVRQAEARKSEPRQAEVRKPEVRKPEVHKSGPRQAEVRKPEVRKPEVRKAEQRQADLRKPEARRSNAPQTEARAVKREQPHSSRRDAREAPKAEARAVQREREPPIERDSRAQSRPAPAPPRTERREVQRPEVGPDVSPHRVEAAERRGPRAAPGRKGQENDDAAERRPQG